MVRQKPKLGCLKWNVDGSALGKPGTAGVGGVPRDHLGRFICAFPVLTRIKDSNEDEVLAI